MAWRSEEIFGSSGSWRIHVRSAAAAATPLLLLHGFTGSGRDWTEVGAGLADRPLIAPDLPGHGDTTVPPASFDAVVDSLVSALDGMGTGSFDLLGYSMGGRLALALALAYPDRVRRLVLESASPGLPTAAERARRRAADAELARLALRDGIAAFVDRWEQVPVLATEERLSPERRAQQRSDRMLCDPAGLAASLERMGTGTQPWLGDRLAELRLPVLLIAGERDPKFLDVAATMASRIVDARRAICAGAGHNVHLEKPDPYVRYVRRFLDARDPVGDVCAENRGGEEAAP